MHCAYCPGMTANRYAETKCSTLGPQVPTGRSAGHRACNTVHLPRAHVGTFRSLSATSGVCAYWANAHVFRMRHAMHTHSRRRSFSIALALALAGLTSLSSSEGAGRANIDASVDATVSNFYRHVRGSRELVRDAAAVLVFPTVVKAGIGIGGEYGEGALLVRGKTVDYYNTASASIGFQLGAETRSVVIVFMTEDAFASFQRSDGWKIGVDASVALINIGAGGSIDTSRLSNPIVGFIFDEKGLMYNLTLEGSKISRMPR